MKIDRHNYEKFFILYWDNELAVAERQAVDDFINQNADLREEFELLGEARFSPDADIQFNQKDFLLNNSFINITNYEEQLLDYIDDEVTATGRKEIEKFVGQNPAAQKELALLQKTKLQPEAEISFPDKSVLYRRSERVRVISMTWFRVAAAAVIIVIAGLVVFRVVNKKSVEIASVAKTDTKKNIPVINDPNISTGQTTNDPANKKTGNDDKKETGETNGNSDKKDQVDKNALAQNSTDQGKNENSLPVSKRDVVATDPNETIKEAGVIVVLEEVGEAQKSESDAINTSFTNSDVTNKPGPTIYIPEAEVKEKDGGGLKGFLRKTTRVFERRTKIQTTTEDNKLLVGAFAVSLK